MAREDLRLVTMYSPTTKKEDIINTLNGTMSFVDNDFSGVNGLEFVSEEAKNEGFESDIDYITDKLLKSDENNYVNIIESYLSYLFRDYNYYLDYTFNLYSLNGGETIISVAYTLEG